MFKKLLSNLPFNPSLIGQVSFYARRMKKESSLRRLGLIFIVLAMGVQLLAATSPAEASLSSSSNDIISGGFQTKGQAVLHCLNPSEDFLKILNYYGVGCTEVSNASDETIRSSAREFNSMGRNSVSNPSFRNGRNWSIYTLNIPGVSQQLWMKDLRYWDSGAYSDYRVLKITKNDGTTIRIMYDCGNIVTEGRYNPPMLPPPPPPKPPTVIPQTISCSNLVMNVADNSKIKLSSPVTVRGQASGKNFVSASPYVSMKYDFINSTGKVISTYTTPRVVFQGSVANDTKTYSFSGDKADNYTIKLTVIYDTSKVATGSGSGECIKRLTVEKPCQDVLTTADLEQCLDLHKKAKNITQNISNADGTTAHGGDDIVYTLSVTNSGKVTIPKFVIKENMNDVLEYANITNLNGGQLDKDNQIFWPALDIKPGQIVQKQIGIKVKNPVPSTPVSTSNPGSFNLLMTNVYGNDSVNIKLPGSIVKTVEQTTSLPNTGPGENLIFGFILTFGIAYFYARTKLFASELDIVRQDFSNGGA